MATASTYDQWEDQGLVVGPEVVQAHDPVQWAEDHLKEMQHRMWVAERKATLEDGKPGWWSHAARRIHSLMQWFHQSLGAALPEGEGAPNARTRLGRGITAEAQHAVPEEWLGQWLEETETALRFVVTVGRRRTAEGWRKADRRSSNKLANALVKELNLIHFLRERS